MQLSDRLLLTQLQLRGFGSRHLSTTAGRMHVLDAPGRGRLPPLLVLHGFSAAGHLYEGVLTRMRPHVRHVIAPDMLGHGFSEMPARGLDHQRMRTALLETIDRVVREPVIVFGNSMGGAAALQLAIDRPGLVRGLFLVAPGGAPCDDAELSAFRARFELRDHEAALDFVDRLFARPHPMRHVLAWGTRQKFARPGLRDLLHQLRPEDLVTPEHLASLRAPLHLLWGAADRVLTPSHLDFWRRHLPPHARLSVIDHYGHVPHIDHPDDLHARLLAFAHDVGASEGGAASAERPDFSKDSAGAAA